MLLCRSRDAWPLLGDLGFRDYAEVIQDGLIQSSRGCGHYAQCRLFDFIRDLNLGTLMNTAAAPNAGDYSNNQV